MTPLTTVAPTAVAGAFAASVEEEKMFKKKEKGDLFIYRFRPRGCRSVSVAAIVVDVTAAAVEE